MNKKDYIEAVNEIKVGDNLKKETLNKVKEKKSNKKIYALAGAVATLVLATAVFVPITKINKNNPIIAKTETNLPKINNFSTLYEILQKNQSNSYTKGDMLASDDLAIAESAKSESVSQSTSTTNSETVKDYSDTNVQVEGVDEADIVKTDGKYIYYLTGNKITIVDAKDENNLKIVSEIKYQQESNNNFYPREVYVENNKLIVIGTKTIYNEDIKNNDKYYYYNNSKIFTVAITYDISNKEDIKLLREVEVEGNYLSSRMVGENVYLISNKYIYSYWLRDIKFEDVNEEEYKPQYVDTVVDNSIKSLEFDSIYYFPESDDTSYLNIASFSVNNNKAANIQSYLGAGNEIYASENNLYITKVKYDYERNIATEYFGYNYYDVNTSIYKFNIDGANVNYIAEGKVPGSILNQFSMDEKDGFFRIATTDSQNWNNEDDTNNLYVLNGDLEIVGKVEDLARGERIYSVRFMEDKAYMVTFVETDPLFVIDLSEPTNPTVLGELKIPGYSKYLHPYDENHIIGFGEDTKIENYGYGEFVTTNGMKMALFDVTDPTNPKEMYSIKIGEEGTYSELLYNHKALLFSKEKDIIAFPVSISKDSGSYRSNLKFQGAIVYGIDLEKGFTLKGQIAHMQIENGYVDYDYQKAVERIIYIKDTLYTLSQGLIKATYIGTMQELSNVEIETEGNNYGYIEYID